MVGEKGSDRQYFCITAKGNPFLLSFSYLPVCWDLASGMELRYNLALPQADHRKKEKELCSRIQLHIYIYI